MRLLVLLLLASPIAWAQPRPQVLAKPPIIPPAPVWQPVTRAAGMIFSGVVLQVDRPTNSTGTTQITFRVEHAMRGVRTGQIVRISEWGGLWNTGEQYVNGERVLLFLYPQSKLGLTSPVGGRSGRFAVDSLGRVLISTFPLGSPRPVPLKTVKAQIARSLQE